MYTCVYEFLDLTLIIHPILTSVFKLCSGFAKDNRIYRMACPMSQRQKNVEYRFFEHSISFLAFE